MSREKHREQPLNLTNHSTRTVLVRATWPNKPDIPAVAMLVEPGDFLTMDLRSGGQFVIEAVPHNTPARTM